MKRLIEDVYLLENNKIKDVNFKYMKIFIKMEQKL